MMQKQILMVCAVCAWVGFAGEEIRSERESAAIFKKARPVWFADTSALAKAKTAELATWLRLDEQPTFVRVASDRPVRFNFDWTLVGWIPGDGRAHDFPILSGKGAHYLSLEAAADATFVCAEAYRADGSVIACTTAADGGAEKPLASCLTKDGKSVPLKGVSRDGFTRTDAFACQPSLVAFKSSTGKHWLYQLEQGKSVIFTAAEKVRGLPTAGIYCNEPGTLVVKWGERPSEQARIVCEKEGEAGFKVIDPVVFDKMTITVERGQFEVNCVGATTLTDLDLALSSLTTSDAKLNTAFTAAKRANDRVKAFDLIKKALGITKFDRQGKVLAFDPTVRNGLSFCGAKIGVGVDADEVIDFRWMREGTEGMATDSGKLPAGWKVVRDFDMQAECQRLVDEAIADGLQGGVQFCAYKDGKCIVNVCGGKLAKEGPAVRTDSLFPIFSTEKPLLSTACHRAVERGLMDYDKPLCTWWPELKGDGKEKLTLRETLGYRTCMPGGSPGGAGNPVCDHELSLRELCDWEKVCKTAAADRPYATPGTVQAYLPFAFAWMIGHPLEVAMKKPLKQVLDEEVLIPSGIEKDFYFVVPREEYPRVAKFYYGAFCEKMNEDWTRQALMPSAWAVSSAEALCKFYNRLCGYDGKTPLIRKETLDEALKPCRRPSGPLPSAKSMKRDWFMLFGMGYGLWGSAERMDRVFGHGGAGGSEALVDRDQKLIVGYTCNYCKNCTAIRDKLYEVVGMRWRYWSDNVNIQDLQMTTSAGGTFGAGITSH